MIWIDDADRPKPHQRRRSSWRGSWGYTPVLAEWFDSPRDYDDVIECCRRQGFLDALGDDLLPASYDNGEYEHSTTAGLMRAAGGSKLQRELQEEYEGIERGRQEERERVSTAQWQAAIARQTLTQRLEAGRVEHECQKSWELAARLFHLETGEVAWLGRRDETQPGYHESWLIYMRMEVERHGGNVLRGERV